MADDAFGDALFAEFDRADAPSDRVLMSKITKDLSDSPTKHKGNIVSEKNGKNEGENGDNLDAGASDNTSSSEESDESETESSPMDTGAIDQSSHVAASLLSQLKKENHKLKQLIGTDSRCKLDEGPAMEIIYMNHPFARRHHHEIEDFISHLLEQDRHMLGGMPDKMATVAGRPNILCLAGNSGKTPTPMEKLRQMQTGMVLGCSHHYQTFVMDIMGWPLVEYDPSKTDGWFVPYYMQVFLEPLPFVEEDEDFAAPKKAARPKRSCFNCGGEHSLSECTEQRNPQRIRESMKEFKANQTGPQASLKNRYHEEECEPRFALFKPGKVSSDLRDALGLRSSQIPPYIYMMRQLGYPPGWLEAAKEETSGLAVFDGAGKELNSEGETVEEGEVSEANVVHPKYNTDKLVDYPGFNMPLPEGCKDEYEKLGSVPMDDQHSKAALKLFLTPADGPPSGRKRKRGKGGSAEDGETPDKKARGFDDMDLDSSQTEDEDVSGTNTPTIEDLEAQRRLIQLQLALAEGSNSSGDMAVVDSLEDDPNSSQDSDFIPPVPPTPERPPLPPGTPPVTPNTGTPSSAAAANTSFKTPHPVSPLSFDAATTPQTVHALLKTPSSGGSIDVNLGTPVRLERTPTPNKGLPTLEKFSLGVSQHIPFENLPDTTGSFKKLRTVISDIRNKRDSL